MNKETIQSRRNALAADIQRNQDNQLRTKSEIAKGQEQLAFYEREFHTIHGALQTCDTFLNEIHEDESKKAEANSAHLELVTKNVSDREDAIAAAEEEAARG